MIRYLDQEERIKDAFAAEGHLLLQEFTDGSLKLGQFRLERQFHPLRHSWSAHAGADLGLHLRPFLAFLKVVTGQPFDVELLSLARGDFSLLNDDIPAEKGIMAFLECSEAWDDAWGGTFHIEQDHVALPVNSMLLTSIAGHRWFLKYVNHLAKNEKRIIVFREKN